MDNDKLITAQVLFRWFVFTPLGIFVFYMVGINALLFLTIIAAIFCEIYWYLWQSEKLKHK